MASSTRGEAPRTLPLSGEFEPPTYTSLSNTTSISSISKPSGVKSLITSNAVSVGCLSFSEHTANSPSKVVGLSTILPLVDSPLRMSFSREGRSAMVTTIVQRLSLSADLCTDCT
jgi:hypothetical protein